MRVAHLDTEMSAFSANITFCHIRTSLSLNLCSLTSSQHAYNIRLIDRMQGKFILFSILFNMVSFFIITKCENSNKKEDKEAK